MKKYVEKKKQIRKLQYDSSVTIQKIARSKIGRKYARKIREAKKHK